MASTASKYMLNDTSRNDHQKKERSASFNALIHSTETDLTALLIATKNGIDRIPIVYLWEAKA